MKNFGDSKTVRRLLWAAALALASHGMGLAAVLYVDANSTNATPPYTNWATAATNIQDAVDAALAGDNVVVTNGIYARGGDGWSRVLVGKALTIQSVNGAGATIINGGGLVRCVALTDNAVLTGFTLTNGASSSYDLQGGGGALGGRLNNCIVTGNFCPGAGGGAQGCTFYNCVLTANSALYSGGGADSSTLYNCTIAGNSAVSPYSVAEGGGASSCLLYNSIVYNNTAPQFPNCDSGCSLYFCWTDVSPHFVNETSGNLRLQSNSPCINAGNNAFAPQAPDLDGNPRIVGGIVDIGAYEYQSLSLINLNVISNQAAFNITGQSNEVVVVETSTDLLNWSPLVTNTLTGRPFLFSDPTPAILPKRFYRAQAQ